MLELGAQSFGLLFAIESRAEHSVEVEVVERPEGMGDDDVRDELRERVGVLAAVLVDVDDRVGWCEFADALELDVLRPADLGDVSNRLPWMDAEARPPDQVLGEIEVADELGDAGDQARRSGRSSAARLHVAPVFAADVVERGGDLAEGRDFDGFH